MEKLINKAVKKLGRICYIKGRKGYAVIIPARYSRKIKGGVDISVFGRGDPEKYYIYCDAELADGVHYGDIVSDTKNEYYILWTDEIKSTFGDYSKLCARKTERGGV